MSLKLPAPRPEITADFLLSESKSSLALAQLSDWLNKKNKKAGDLTAVWFCDDARLMASYALGTRDIMSFRSVAAAGNPKAFSHMIDHGSVGQAIVFGHYDSTQQQQGKHLMGCGGLHVKESRIDTNEQAPPDQAHGFVDRNIEHADVVVQTLQSAYKTAQLNNSSKPILAALLDHITYQTIPIGIFTRDEKGEIVYNGIVSLEELKKKNAQSILSEAVTQIKIELLPPKLQQLLSNNNNLIEINNGSPFFTAFQESQKTQDPPLVWVSTSSVPLEVRQPSFNQPNMVFKIGLQHEKTDEYKYNGEFILPYNNIQDTIAQVHYPISHCLKAKQQGDGFYSTRTIVIETADYAASKYLREELMKHGWFKKWLHQKGGKVILVETRRGKITQIGDMQR